MKENTANAASEKQKLAEQFLTTLRNRNWDLLRSLMMEDVVWSLPGNSVISGEALGVDAVIQRGQTIVSYGVSFELKHILIGQHGAALSFHNTARRGDLTLDEHLATVLKISNQKIAAINTYLSDVGMVNTFFVRP